MKTNHHREFSNMPTYEESIDLWRKEIRSAISPFFLVANLLAMAASIGIFLLSAHGAENFFPIAFPSPGTTMKAKEMFLMLGFALGLVSFASLSWCFLQWPPRPTRSQHDQLSTLMRTYQEVQDAEKQRPHAA